MAQLLTQVKNPWGSQAGDSAANVLDAQRADLFTVNLSNPLSTVIKILSGANDALAAKLLAALPTANTNLIYLANSFEFPEHRTSQTTTRRHVMAYPFPGYDDVNGTVTITFTHDAKNNAISYVLALLRSWTAIVRAGRDGQDPNELQLDLKTASLTGGLIPSFRNDFIVNGWRGLSTTPPGETNSSIEASSKWLVKRAWPVAFAPTPFRHAGSGIQEIKATFCADAVVEV